MKYILIAAVALLALAQGSFAQEATGLDKMTQYFETVKNQFNEMLNNQELTNQARTFLTQRTAEMEPLVSQIQENLRTAVADAGEQMRPVADNLNAQMQEFQTQVQDLFKRLMDQTPALGN